MADSMMNPFNGNNKQIIKYGKKSISINSNNDVLASNLIFNQNKIEWYSKFNRYGYIDPFDTDQVVREFLFFTKPDLYLYDGKSFGGATLRKELSSIPIFKDADNRHRKALSNLQLTINDPSNKYNPFMYILSNAVTSKLDLPAISAEYQESTANVMGTSISYRGHSLKADNGYDFNLSFTDTAYLEIYTIVKIYDEYMRLIKLGDISPKKEHIINRIIPEQFSVYKFLIGSDGETILYYAKATGVSFTDVPRSDLSDPGADGFKFSLGFHAQFVEDSNPMILSEFNRLVPYKGNNFISVMNSASGGVDNSWVTYPRIIHAEDKRTARRHVGYDYRMKWIK